MLDNELDNDQPEFWLRKAEGDLIIARGAYVAAAGAVLRRAEGDFVVARGELKRMEPTMRLFHAQQAVEKALKGVLVARGLPYPRTHNIQVLINLLRANGVEVPEDADFAADFTEFASTARYGGRAIPNLLLSDAGCDKAAEVAAAVLEWAKTELK